MFKAYNKAISHMGIHECSRAIQLLRCQVGTVLPDVTDPLVMDHIRPAGAKEVSEGEMHQEVA